MSSKLLLDALIRTAEECLSTVQREMKNPALASWCEMHGWKPEHKSSALDIARQAALLYLIRETFPGVRFFPTPLDRLIAHIQIGSIASESRQFNFWGELYAVLIPQAERREIGQFWTSELISNWMIAWLLQFRPAQLVDIGCGSGNFLVQAGHAVVRGHLRTRLYGCDKSPMLLNIALANMASQELQIPHLVEQDYLNEIAPMDADAVICNPPYTRHHLIAPRLKDQLRELFHRRLHLQVSRLATMATYFLLKLIADIPVGARAAVILPMQVLDARYGRSAKHILASLTRISAIIHFAPAMNAFENVDVGAAILFFQKQSAEDNLVRHLTLRALPSTEQLLALLESEKSQESEFGSLVVQPQRELDRVPKWFAVRTDPALSRWEQNGLVVPLRDLAVVMRGIATGANDFFALPTSEVKQRALERFVVPTIQRNREIQDIILDKTYWKRLSDEGKRIWLLYLDNQNISQNPMLRHYISEGEKQGYHRRSLVNTRKRWYLMEQRRIPPIFFTILTRGNPRFILNKAGVRPLNMFSFIYPNRRVVEDDCVEILWTLLNSDFCISRLHSVSRTYGGNTLKVEPRELDNLPVINPLALPDETKQNLKMLIADFDSHRQTDKFLAQVNMFVKEHLENATASSDVIIQPKQLVLLESREKYSSVRAKGQGA